MTHELRKIDTSASIHASAVKVGEQAVLIRGPSGAGKSRLAFELILAGRSGQIPRAVLVGDDRVHLDTRGGEVWVRPAEQLAGLIEIRGLGIRACDYVAAAKVGFVVDLMAEDAERLPPPASSRVVFLGIEIPRIAVGAGFAPFLPVAAALITAESSYSGNLSADCVKGIGNHITGTIASE
jgi:serine kinase of HPr protein (carbohydrate metabolism regulator)